MGWKLWQVGGDIGERHGDVPSVSKFTPPVLLNTNLYLYYIYIHIFKKTVGVSTHVTEFGEFMWATCYTFHNYHVFSSSKLVGSDEDVCTLPL